MLEPCYCENIIVGVMHKRVFNWYITHKNLWKLDYKKLYENIKKQYESLSFSQKKLEYDVGNFEFFCGTRWGISVLDENSADQFLKKIQNNLIRLEELKRMYLRSGEKQFEYLPALYVDFDKRKLYSYFPEPEDFENFVPNNWNGEYKDFYQLIPKNMIYWSK